MRQVTTLTEDFAAAILIRMGDGYRYRSEFLGDMPTSWRAHITGWFLDYGLVERKRAPSNPKRPLERHTQNGNWMYRVTPKGRQFANARMTALPRHSSAGV